MQSKRCAGQHLGYRVYVLLTPITDKFILVGRVDSDIFVVMVGYREKMSEAIRAASRLLIIIGVDLPFALVPRMNSPAVHITAINGYVLGSEKNAFLTLHR